MFVKEKQHVRVSVAVHQKQKRTGNKTNSKLKVKSNLQWQPTEPLTEDRKGKPGPLEHFPVCTRLSRLSVHENTDSAHLPPYAQAQQLRL